MESIKIFIAYAKEDIAKVRPVYETLKNAGYDPCWMKWKSPPVKIG